MNNDTLLTVQNLKHYFPVRSGVFKRHTGNVHAVDDISFVVHRGETLGLVGESGCGKSTVAKAVLRLVEPTAGQIIFERTNLLDLDKSAMRHLRRQMQIVLQDPAESLNARHTVGALLAEPFVIHRLGSVAERKQWVMELLATVGLPAAAAERFPHEFSGGQRQRIGIARAIALKPKLLICDEPVSALDVSIQSQILNLLLALQRDMGLTVLFIAHDLAVVKHISDRIAVMYLGQIVEIAAAEVLYQTPLHPYTQALIAAIPVPEPTQQQNLEYLQGEVPSPINPPAGCRFHTRCRYVQQRCREEQPHLRPLSATNSTLAESHQVACHFAERILSADSAGSPD